MATNPVAKIAVSLKLQNGRTVTLHEGDIVKGLKFKDGNDLNCIDGAIRVLNATAKNVAPKHYCLPESYISSLININSIVVDMSEEYDAELKTIPIATILDIVEIEENEGAIKVGTGSQYTPLADVIAAAPEGAVIELGSGTYDADINITKSIKLVSENGAIIKGNLNVNGESVSRSAESNVSVVLDGLYFTGASKINLNNVNAFSMKNCVYTEHDFAEKTIPIIINLKDKTPIKVNIDDNTFGKENNNCYNIIEVYGYLKNGSTFNGNHFDKGCCTHNQISLYNIEDDAIVEINDNICDVSKNMVRFGFQGKPKAVVEMSGNTYIESDTDNPEWSGLFMVQPFGNATEDMSGLTVNVVNTKKPVGQICYLYAGSKDMQFNDDNKPTINVDGRVFVPVILS